MEPIDALNVRTIHWTKEKTIRNTPWRIRGYSRAAFRTGFYIPELDLMLDAGPQNFNKPSHILITHTHIDHVACLPFTMIGEDVNPGKLQVYGPTEAQNYIYKYIKTMFEVNAMVPNISAKEHYDFTGLKKDDTFNITTKGSNLEIKTFECDHAIPTVSYGISDIKLKLKPEYLGMDGKEIGRMRKEGVEITHPVAYKRLAYVCDTSIKVFELNPDILEYDTIFIECTFLMDDELDNAKKTKHIHWSQLKPYVLQNPDKQFVLFHFSLRYRDSEIKQFVEEEMEKEGITNLDWW